MDEITASPPDVVEVTLVTTTACHFCEDAHARLGELAGRGLLKLSTVPADSPAGQALIGEHRPRMFPLTLVGGRFFNDGRISRGKLARLVEQLDAR
ncbi:glutaredoxin [Tessaracoccus sp. OS52]|uniref:glutaredoxin n=1 Tax=Tessaracoccus sp. OS52 TaxID=2886691 RepID=UPI001D114E46|nr:glutaredoxin [Tessaracoccus sp. OS52]MCC2592496.1 glutaredoxin [Tessaracoccus sp. OS52]